MISLMVKAEDVANFFIELCKDDPDPMTPLRLEKILFEAQAWSLVKLGKVLFEDDIEAWGLGPVVPYVYERFKGTRDAIRKTSKGYSSSVFTRDQMMLMVNVANYVSNMSTDYMIDRTHAAGSPWEAVYNAKKRNKIPLDLIREYYEKLDLKEFDVKKAFGSLKEAGPRDENGNTVLSGDWD